MLVSYDQAVKTMEQGLLRFMEKEDARELAEIFAGNSLDGVHSHGMNRYPRYIADMESGLCDARVTQAERTGGYGAFETWDAHFGVGPLIARRAAARAGELAREHGVACVALRNNSHWLRAGRYALELAETGLAALCFTNTCMNLTAYGAKQPSTGNNPFAMALPRAQGPLLLDMAVSQYAYGKLEIMAQRGETLPEPCGYDEQGRETRDPAAIIRSGLMLPMALWKGSALSVMLDLAAATLSGGRTSLEIGAPAQGERGMSQVFLALHPAAVVDMAQAQARVERTLDFLHKLETGAVRAPGERLYETRARCLREGIPVEEETWEKILAASARR